MTTIKAAICIFFGLAMGCDRSPVYRWEAADLCEDYRTLREILSPIETDLSSISDERQLFKRLYEYGIGVDPGWTREPVFWDDEGNRVHPFSFDQRCENTVANFAVFVKIGKDSKLKVDFYLGHMGLNPSVIKGMPTLKELTLRAFDDKVPDDSHVNLATPD